MPFPTHWGVPDNDGGGRDRWPTGTYLAVITGLRGPMEAGRGWKIWIDLLQVPEKINTDGLEGSMMILWDPTASQGRGDFARGNQMVGGLRRWHELLRAAKVDPEQKQAFIDPELLVHRAIKVESDARQFLGKPSAPTLVEEANARDFLKERGIKAFGPPQQPGSGSAGAASIPSPESGENTRPPW